MRSLSSKALAILATNILIACGVAPQGVEETTGTTRQAVSGPCQTNDQCGPGLTCNLGICGVSGGGSCPTGQTLCGSGCVDLQSDAANCGSCSEACAAGSACVDGSCQAPLIAPAGPNSSCQTHADCQNPLALWCVDGTCQDPKAAVCGSVTTGFCSAPVFQIVFVGNNDFHEPPIPVGERGNNTQSPIAVDGTVGCAAPGSDLFTDCPCYLLNQMMPADMPEMVNLQPVVADAAWYAGRVTEGALHDVVTDDYCRTANTSSECARILGLTTPAGTVNAQGQYVDAQGRVTNPPAQPTCFAYMQVNAPPGVNGSTL
jgi:hypothetical protein